MESRSTNLENQKQKVLSFIDTNGPSLPMKIANYLRSDSIIVSAFLSELLNEKKLKLSNMKVGNSPLYYARGQEFQLEKFSQYLNSKEREAFELLRENRILMDERMEPAIRVALRSIKDFAFPFELNGKIYWRYMKIPQDQAVEIIQERIKIPEAKTETLKQPEQKPFFEKIKEVVMPNIQKFQEIKPELVERGIETNFQMNPLKKQGIEITKRETEFISEKKEDKKDLNEKSEDKKIVEVKIDDKEKSKLDVSDVEKPLISLKQKKETVKDKSDFVDSVVKFLENRELTIDKEFDWKKKEYYAKIKGDNSFGKVSYYLIAKDKKTITENDLLQAIQTSSERKMPVVLISPGEPNKKAAEKLDEVENLVFYLKLG